MAKILALAFLRPELSGGAVSILPSTPPILGPGCHGAFSPPCPLQALHGGAVASKLPSCSHRMPAPQGQLQELNSRPASSPGKGAAWSHSEPLGPPTSVTWLGVTGQLSTHLGEKGARVVEEVQARRS